MIAGIASKLFSDRSDLMETKFSFCQQSPMIPATANDHNDHNCWDRIRVYSLVSIWSLTIVTKTFDRFDRHNCWCLISIVTGIVQIAGHIISLWLSRLLPSLCYGFHMIAGIITIVKTTAVAALVVSINILQSLTVIHNRYDHGDRLWFYLSDRVIIAMVGSRWDHWRSLAKWKFGFHMVVTINEQFTSNPSDHEQSPTIIWKPGISLRS